LGRDALVPEGTVGVFRLGRPFFSLATESSFEVEALWRFRPERVFQGAAVRQLQGGDGITAPHAYQVRELSLSAWEMRAWPGAFRMEIGGGGGGYTHAYRPLSGLSPEQEQLLRAQALPRSEDAGWVGVRLRAFHTDYRVLRDVDTFALPEDLQVGLLLRGEMRLAASRPGFLEAWSSARYRYLAGDALFTASAAGSLRWIVGGGPEEVVNRRGAVELSVVSPWVGIGRLVARASFQVRAADLDKTVLFLGGGNGLRGLEPEVLQGTRIALMNLEYRTRPVEIATLHVGGVLFWDGGSAWGVASSPFPQPLVHTVGLGLRALFPQFDVEPLRIDFGFVLEGPSPPPFERFSASFGQITRYRPSMLETPFE
ncbi:MAG TPA: BamA/TamA family outer membrane protein, partial [Myxococcaceae bacterium]|nr:BamA/TamA family outer membrane protein [Myxococcaceae bacterium]